MSAAPAADRCPPLSLPQTAPLTPRGTTGTQAELTTSAQSLRVTAPASVTVVAVEDCPALVSLDLSPVAGLTWLAISGCPALERVRLPAGAHSGSAPEVHVAFPGGLRPLLLEGSIGEVDASWWEGKSEQRLASPHRRHRRAPLMGAFLGPLWAPLPDGVELALLAGDGQSPSALTLEAPLREAHVAYGALTHLRLVGLDVVEVSDLGQLTYLELADPPAAPAPPVRLRLSGVPALQEVTGRCLPITEGETRALTSDDLGPTAIQDALNAGNILRDGGARFNSDSLPLALTFLLQAEAEAEGANHQNRPLIHHWITKARKPGHVVEALRALATLASRGEDPAKLWSTRTALRHGCGLAKTSGRWHWLLSSDLGVEGWRADLQVWRHCRARWPVDEAAPGLGAMGEPVHLEVLLETLAQDPTAPDAPLVLDLVRTILGVSEDCGPLEGWDSTADRDHLRRAMRPLTRLHGLALAEGLTPGLVRWIFLRVPPGERLCLLTTLYLLGSGEARRALIRLRAASPDPTEIAGATQALLTPPSHSLLA